MISIKLQSKFIEVTLRYGCSFVNLMHVFRTPFTKNTSERLLLLIVLFCLLVKNLMKFRNTLSIIIQSFYNSFESSTTLQTHHVNFTLKERGNCRFHIVSTWNPLGVFVGSFLKHLWDMHSSKSNFRVLKRASLSNSAYSDQYMCPISYKADNSVLTKFYQESGYCLHSL